MSLLDREMKLAAAGSTAAAVIAFVLAIIVVAG